MSFNALASQEFSTYEICKAAISSEMLTKVDTIKNVNSTNLSPQIQYRRKDGVTFKYNCEFQGDRVIWRTYFNDQYKVGWGRWRNNEADAVITYEIKNGVLLINNNQTSTTPFKFNKQDFK